MFKSSFYFFMLCLFTVQSVFAAVESSENIKEASHHINTHQLHAQSHQQVNGHAAQQVDINLATINGNLNTDVPHQDEHESCHAHFHFHPTMLIELTTFSPIINDGDVLIARQHATQKRITSLYRPPVA